MRAGFLDSRGGDGKKKKKKNNSTSTATSAPKVVNEGGMNEVGTTVLESFRLLPIQVTTSAGNAPGLFFFQFSSMEGLDAMLENGPWFIRNNMLILKKWHPDENLLKEDVRYVLVWVKLYGVPVTTFSGDDLSAIATELGVGEKNTLRKPSQTSQGVLVCPKMRFKPHKEYRPVPKKSNASFSGNKLNHVEPTIKATSSGSSFMNVDNSTPFIDKIGKFEDLLSSGQAILVDNAGNPLKKVEFSGDYDSKDEVASVDNDMARSLASERVGFGNQSLLEQWRDSYGNSDYDEDPYDEDMYEGQDVTQEIQAICDNLDI
ncbi:hypothetical protein Tco_0833040 [Tanacetum coccineum]